MLYLLSFVSNNAVVKRETCDGMLLSNVISVDAMACSSLSPQVKARSPSKADLSIYIPFVSTSTFFSSSALTACLSPLRHTPSPPAVPHSDYSTHPYSYPAPPTYPYAPQCHTAHASKPPHPRPSVHRHSASTPDNPSAPRHSPYANSPSWSSSMPISSASADARKCKTGMALTA